MSSHPWRDRVIYDVERMKERERSGLNSEYNEIVRFIYIVFYF